MDTPRASSNGLLTVVCVALLGLCGYKVYQDRLESERQANLAAITPKPKASPKPPIEKAVAIAHTLESFYVQLFADLNKEYPVDLVPQLTILRERIRDRQMEASKEKAAVYLAGIKLMDSLISAAEDRTDALEELLKVTAQPRPSLESGTTVNSSTQHFVSMKLRRFSESQKRKKAVVDALFAQLRNSEREWNSQLAKNSPPEFYDLTNIPAAIITVDTEVRANPLEKRAYDRRSWRYSYYDRYGYPRVPPDQIDAQGR